MHSTRKSPVLIRLPTYRIAETDRRPLPLDELGQILSALGNLLSVDGSLALEVQPERPPTHPAIAPVLRDAEEGSLILGIDFLIAAEMPATVREATYKNFRYKFDDAVLQQIPSALGVLNFIDALSRGLQSPSEMEEALPLLRSFRVRQSLSDLLRGLTFLELMREPGYPIEIIFPDRKFVMSSYGVSRLLEAVPDLGGHGVETTYVEILQIREPLNDGGFEILGALGSTGPMVMKVLDPTLVGLLSSDASATLLNSMVLADVYRPKPWDRSRSVIGIEIRTVRDVRFWAGEADWFDDSDWLRRRARRA